MCCPKKAEGAEGEMGSEAFMRPQAEVGIKQMSYSARWQAGTSLHVCGETLAANPLSHKGVVSRVCVCCGFLHNRQFLILKSECIRVASIGACCHCPDVLVNHKNSFLQS